MIADKKMDQIVVRQINNNKKYLAAGIYYENK